MSRKSSFILGIILMFLMFVAAPLPHAQADETTDLMNEAIRMYNQGDVTGAAIILSQVRMLFEYKRSEVIRSYLPEPFSGWMEDIDEHNQKPVLDVNKQLADLKRGRRFEAHRHYHGPEGKEVMVSVEINTSKARDLREGQELISIKGYNGYVDFTQGASGSITIFVGDDVAVKISGAASREELMAYAQVVNYSVFQEYAF